MSLVEKTTPETNKGKRGFV